MAEVVEAASGKFAAVAEEIGFFRPLHHMKPDIIFGFGDIRKLSVVVEDGPAVDTFQKMLPLQRDQIPTDRRLAGKERVERSLTVTFLS